MKKVCSSLMKKVWLFVHYAYCQKKLTVLWLKDYKLISLTNTNTMPSQVHRFLKESFLQECFWNILKIRFPDSVL